MKALVVGGAGGLGLALVQGLLQSGTDATVFATWHRSRPAFAHPRLTWLHLDATDEGALQSVAAELPHLHRLINCAGMLHTADQGPEKSVSTLQPDFFLESMRINALPTLLLAKHLGPRLRHRDPAVFAVISARVGSIGDNRLGGWYSYRASKAALNMAIRTLSHEWRHRLPNCAVAALHPGTVDTALSRPFQARVPADRLFTPEHSAACLLRIIGQLQPQESGRFWSWDGKEIPW